VYRKRHGPFAVEAKLLPITPGWKAAAATPSSPQRRTISLVNRMFASFALPYAELAEYRRSALRSSMSKREKRRAATLEVWMTEARADEAIAQQIREQERRQMVRLEGRLEAVDRDRAIAEDAARVVREHVDARIARPQFVGERAHLGEHGEVGDVERHAEFIGDLPRPPRVAPTITTRCPARSAAGPRRHRCRCWLR
jgi:hypothetical protein